MVTLLKLLFLSPDHKINLWSQQLIFGKTFSDFLFLDILKMSIFHFSKKVLGKKESKKPQVSLSYFNIIYISFCRLPQILQSC